MITLVDFVQQLDATIIPSTIFSILHALQNAYNVQKTANPGSTLFKNAFSTVVLACGGGIMTSFLLGNPQKVFFSSTDIPIYCGISLIISLFPQVLKAMDSVPGSARNSWFNLIDALSRGYALPRFLSGLRTIETQHGHCSLIGQLILSCVAMTGGGLLYGWFFQNRPWKIGGWNFNWICTICLLNLAYFEILDAHPSNSLNYNLLISLERNSLLIGISELKLVSSILIFLVLISKPKVLVASKLEEKTSSATKSKSNEQNDQAPNSPNPKKAGFRSSSPRRSRRSKKIE